MTTTTPTSVIWHDVECGGYGVDLPVWRELADGADGPILDVGAGTGRVALDLARFGHRVVALDSDADLLAALRERAGGLPVETVHADARDFDLGEHAVALILVPMQTLQLLGGAEGRAAFLRRAARALVPGGLLAVSLAKALPDGQDDARFEDPMPDIREIDETVYASHPLGARRVPGGVVIERLRETIDPAGGRSVANDEIRLDDLDGATLSAEAVALGCYEARPARAVPATDDYVGSEVVVLCRS